MSTNKTRVFVFEAISSSGPYQSVTEFDVYQDAIDYCKSMIVAVRVYNSVAYAIVACVYSYDNTSYRFECTGTQFRQIEIEFPDTETWIEA